MRSKPTKTTNRLHFEDLAAGRFEDLCHGLIYNFRNWKEIHPDGKAGSDGGVDIRAVEIAENDELRNWSIQCRRLKSASFSDLKAAVKDVLSGATVVPDVLLVVVGCNVTKNARVSYEEYAKSREVNEPLLWQAANIEAMLYNEHPDLLFTFFGISLSRRSEKRERLITRELALKKKLHRVFPHSSKDCRFLIRSVDDKTFPVVESEMENKISPWFRATFLEHYHNGIAILLGRRDILVRSDIHINDAKWRFSKSESELDFVDDDTPNSGGRYVLKESIERQGWSYFDAEMIGKIPFINIVEVDELGDEFGYGPHVICRYADEGEPYEEIVYRIDESYDLASDLQIIEGKER